MRIVIPQASPIPLTALHDAVEPAWFDVYSETVTEEDDEDEAGLIHSTQLVHDLLDEERARAGSSQQASRIILGGFGQGGALAIHAGLSYKYPLAGIVSCNGYVPLPERYPDWVCDENRNTRLLAVHGTGDRAIDIEFAKKRYEKLLQAQVPLEWREEFRTGHFLSENQLLSLQQWWLSVIRAARQNPQNPQNPQQQQKQ